MNPPTDDEYRELARAEFGNEGTLEFDDEPEVSRSGNGEEGAYVAAWVWVDNPEEEN